MPVFDLWSQRDSGLRFGKCCYMKRGKDWGTSARKGHGAFE